MAEYLVIKLNGNWIKRGKNRKLIEMCLKGTHFEKDLEYIEPFLLRVTKSVSKEWVQAFGKTPLDHAKKEIAMSLAESLLQDGFIQFKEEEYDNRICIEGSLLSIPTPERKR